jgi:CRISPR-associated protein Csd2
MTRYDFLFLFDVKDANPNGDPDAGNLPRIDPETGHGLVTDVCLKRKIRNYVAMKGGPGSRIYFTERSVLNTTNREAWKSIGQEPDKKLPKDVTKAKALTTFMCYNFFDIRTFGAVMSHEINCGQVRGPVQISFARSVEPIITSEHAIAICAAVKENKPIEEQIGIQGRKFTVPYGLYLAHGFVNPFLAAQTGFSDEDLELLWEALKNAFQFDQSAARPAGSMAARKLIVFKHATALGSAPSHVLFDRVKVEPKDPSKPARSFSDFDLKIDRAGIPQGVELMELL